MDFCKSNINAVKFEVIHATDMEAVRLQQQMRFELGKTIPGARSYHYFKPLDGNKILFKRISSDRSCDGQVSFDNPTPLKITIDECKISAFVSCLYDSHWWVGIVEEIDKENQEICGNFMHPHGPSRSFFWTEHIDRCWVAINNVVCKINVPTTTSGRTYKLDEQDLSKIAECTK